MEAYTAQDAEARRVRDVPAWSLEADGDALVREYRFATFVDVLHFIQRCGEEAERMNHHPEWSNVYTRVSVRLTTHDAGGLTDLDYRLAAHMDAVRDGLDAAPA